MAKIVFSARSNIIWRDEDAFDPYYEGLITELKNHGHDLLVIRTNDIIYENNQCINNKVHTIIKDKVKKFKPDLIITTNNSLPDCIYNHTNCPIVLFFADSPAFLEGAANVKKHVERYIFLHFGWESVFHKDCINLFNAKPEQNFEIGYQTAIHSLECEKIYNISFVGILGWGRNIEKDFLKINNNAEFEVFLKRFDCSADEVYLDHASIVHVLTSNMRIKTLDALTDLGLTIFGWKNNIALAIPFSIDLIKCFSLDPITTLAETEQMMNASVISLTLPNAQAIRGVSWRVADVLASNSCLISPPKEDLKLLSPYVDIPTFTSPLEARELCQKLLKDDEWRKDIIAGSNQAINEKHRFSHLIAQLEKIVSMPMHITNDNENTSSYEIISIRTIPLKHIFQRTILQKITYYSMRPRLFVEKVQSKYFSIKY